METKTDRLLLGLLSGIVLLASSCGGGGAFPDAGALVPDAGPSACGVPAEVLASDPVGSSCKSTAQMYFVDALATGPAPDPDFGQNVEDALNMWLDGQCTGPQGVTGLFECQSGPNAAACRNGDFRAFAKVASLLEPRTPRGVARRHDGHLRFFRVAFFNENGELLGVRVDRHCVVLHTLRAIVGAQIRPASGVTMHVGREWCAAQPQGVDWSTGHRQLANGDLNRRATWHLDHIGLEDSVTGARRWPVLSATTAVTTQVVLLDTEVSDVSSLGSLAVVESRRRFVDDLGTAVSHPHGSAMAVTMRTVAGPVPIHNMIVLDDYGRGSVGTLSRGLDAALFELGRGRSEGLADVPLIINISAGVPPEFALTDWCDETVSSTEPLRFLLQLAADMDAPLHPVVVVGATGNRARRDEGPLIQDVADGKTSPQLVAQVSGDYFPASLTRNALSSTTSSPIPLVPVQGLDARGMPYRHGTNASGVALAAPAVGVYPFPVMNTGPWLPSPGGRVHEDDPFDWPRTATTPICQASSWVSLGYTHPSALTGTSVSAALTTGALVAAFQNNTSSLSGTGMARLAYLTATNSTTGQGTGAGLRKRLCVPRLLAALSSTISRRLRDCLEKPGPELILTPPDMVDECWADLPPLSETCPDLRSASLSLPEPDPSSLCVHAAPAGQKSSWSTPSRDDPSLLSTQDSAALGPQPPGSGCPPPCAARIDQSTFPPRITLEIALSNAFDPGATMFLTPFLRIGTSGDYDLALVDGWSAAEWWFPGSAFKISDIPIPTDQQGLPLFTTEGLKNSGFTLVMKIEQDGKTVMDFSPLELIFQ